LPLRLSRSFKGWRTRKRKQLLLWLTSTGPERGPEVDPPPGPPYINDTLSRTEVQRIVSDKFYTNGLGHSSQTFIFLTYELAQ
jgi:hypothetical protein